MWKWSEENSWSCREHHDELWKEHCDSLFAAEAGRDTSRLIDVIGAGQIVKMSVEPRNQPVHTDYASSRHARVKDSRVKPAPVDECHDIRTADATLLRNTDIKNEKRDMAQTWPGRCSK